MSIAWGDWKTKRIPDRKVYVLMILSLVSMRVIPQIDLSQRVFGLFVISIPLLFLTCIISGSIGGGDIKLMAAVGFLLGADNIWRAFVVGILAAGIYVSFLLITKKIDRKAEIALGPFLCLGMIWVLLRI